MKCITDQATNWGTGGRSRLHSREKRRTAMMVGDGRVDSVHSDIGWFFSKHGGVLRPEIYTNHVYSMSHDYTLGDDHEACPTTHG